MTTVSTEPQAIGATDQDVAAGTEVGEYKIEAAIGHGGFGTVYRAVHPLIGKQVAVKVLSRRYSSDPAVVSRFVAEARAVNQIRHRNIIDIFSFGQLADGRHYYVMEYLEGEPLDRVIARRGPMPLATALPILRALARALDAAHAKGIAHRDLKPENIFLAREQDGAMYPKLLDFGIAKLLAPDDDARHRTGTGVPLGTPYYMSPEQCRGRDVDHRTDIYSFGIVAYRLLTGTYPFDGDDYMDLLVKQVNAEPVPPSRRNPELPASVDTAIAWMMRKDRMARPPSVSEGVIALDPNATITPSVPRLRSSRRTNAPSIPPPITDPLAATTASTTAAPLRLRSRGLPWIGGGLVLMLLIAGVVVFVRPGAREAAPRTTPVSFTAPPDGPPVVVTTVPAAIPDAAGPPDHVTLTIEGAPPLAEVSLDGVRLGTPPSVRYGTHPVQLVISAEGYVTETRTITPDHEQQVKANLKHKPAPPRHPSPDDLLAPKF